MFKLLIIGLISIIVLLVLYYLARKFDKYRKIISIIFGVMIFVVFILIIHLYKINNNADDKKYLIKVIELTNDNFTGLNYEELESYSTCDLVRYISSEILNNAELKPNETLTSVDDMFTFAEQFKNVDNVGDWIRCYGKYTGWCLAEYSIDENSIDYWEMMYKSNDKISSYNYGILISYKLDGLFIQYAPVIAVCLLFMQVYTFVLWVLLTFRNIKSYIIRLEDKSDLQN